MNLSAIYLPAFQGVRKACTLRDSEGNRHWFSEWHPKHDYSEMCSKRFGSDNIHWNSNRATIHDRENNRLYAWYAYTCHDDLLGNFQEGGI